MREKFGFLICVWFLLCGNCLGSYVVEKNSLKIISPESIKGVYDCSIGNLGVPQHGGTLAAFVVYPRANQRGCRDFYDFGVSFKLRPGSFPVILLVDRGDCFFALKAWNAQKAGAAAVLIVDDIEEPLFTMDTPEENYSGTGYYLQNITIPSALITKSLGNSIKKALTQREIVVLNLDWRSQSLPHPEPDEPVLEYELWTNRVLEYELWTNSNYECGPKCQTQIEFINTFKKAAQMLEQKGYTQFTPHYITWYCPQAFVLSKQCKSQCIRHGRYCAPDPELDFSKGYDGKDVVVQTLRQACFFKVAKQSGKPWLWWDYVTDFAVHCTMKQHMYTKQCADQVILSLGVDVAEIDDCIGDTEADVEHPVLKAEENSQTGEGTRGDVTILPTLVINNRVYKGKLDKAAVLKAICAGFQGTNTKPPICLSEDVEEANAQELRKEW